MPDISIDMADADPASAPATRAEDVSYPAATASTSAAEAVVPASIFASADLTLSSVGAVSNGKIVDIATLTPGSSVLTANTDVFDAGDVGKTIVVAGAGLDGGKMVTTIVSVESPSSITLGTPAATATSIRGAVVGTDCGPALQAAIDAVYAAGGGRIVIDGLYLLRTPVAAALGNAVAQCSMVGHGSDAGIIVAVDADQDAILFSGGGRIEIAGANFIGTPLELVDARRTLSFIGTMARVRNCGFFGLASIGTDDGAVIYAESTDFTLEENVFGSCVGGLGNPTVMNRNFAGFHSFNNRFLDYGNFKNILFIKTGQSFTKAWVFGENQFAEDANAVGQSVFRSVDDRFDEGHVYAIALSTTVDSGKRISRVEIDGMQVNNSFVDGGTAVYLERVDLARITRSAIGWRNTPGNGLSLNDCGTVEVDGVKITVGAPGTATGMADGILASDVVSLTARDSDFRRFDFTRVDKFQRVDAGQGGVLPFTKSGRVTDADFAVPPPVGTIAADITNDRLYLRTAAGWLATPVLVTSTDPTFALNNVTPATGTLTGVNSYV